MASKRARRIAIFGGELVARRRPEPRHDRLGGLQAGRALGQADDAAQYVRCGAQRVPLCVRFAALQDDVRRFGLRGNPRHDFAPQAALADPGRPGDGHQDRRRVEPRALERAQHLGELRIAPNEGRAARAAPSVHGFTHDRRPVVARTEFIAAAPELAGRGVRQHHPRLRVAR